MDTKNRFPVSKAMSTPWPWLPLLVPAARRSLLAPACFALIALWACGPAAAPVDASADAPDAPVDGDGSTPASHPWAAACPWVAEHTYARPGDALFEPSVLVRIDLEMDPVDYQWLLDNPDLEQYRPAAVTVCGERIETAGLRFKRSSLWFVDLPDGYPKNPMLIDFSEFVSGQRLQGLRHINLEYGGDLMLVAERLNWEVLGGFGVTASRANSVLLYVNGAFVGVFTNVERVDKSYLTAHFNENAGNLYKHQYCGTFLWAGADASAYTSDPRCYEKKTNEFPADYGDLIHVIDVLNNTAGAVLPSELPRVLNTDAWISLMAALQVLGYGDTPNASANNFYTYHRLDTDTFEIIPWDMDGGFWIGGAPCREPVDMVAWDLFQVAYCHDYLPLFHRVVDRPIDRPAWRDQYLRAARRMVEGAFAPLLYAARVLAVADQLAPALAGDPNRDGDDAAWQAALADLVRMQRDRAVNVDAQLQAAGY